MSEQAQSVEQKVKALSLEILTILYSRDLTHDELYKFRKSFQDTFKDFEKYICQGVHQDRINQIETECKQTQKKESEELEKERAERVKHLREQLKSMNNEM